MFKELKIVGLVSKQTISITILLSLIILAELLLLGLLTGLIFTNLPA